MNGTGQGIFAGEGAARAAARGVDWARTPLGPPESWPVSLRSVLGILLSSRHPMFLWWGPELIQFYNDAYLPSFGRGKHPAAMGQRGAECWQEIWPIVQPQIDDAMLRGKASWNEDQLVPIFRNDRIEDVYWTYGYSPVFDDAGRIGGVLVVCTETTAGVLAIRRLDTIRKLASALNGALDIGDIGRLTAQCLREASLDVPFAVVDLGGPTPLLVNLEGPEVAAPSVAVPLEGSLGGSLTFGLSSRLPFDEPYRDFLHQIAAQVSGARARVSIEVEWRRLLLQAPVAAALLTGPQLVFEIANPRFEQMVGRELLGKSYVDAFPEVRGTPLTAIVDGAYLRGEAFSTPEMRVPLARDGGLEDRFFNFSLEPVRDVRGHVYGLMVVAVDITAQVAARHSLERSHKEREHLLAAAQVASRAKDEFLAMLGHELRNPLAPIMTALEVMKVKGVGGLEHERRILERQASHLIHLVDDLLDVSRVVAGKIELKRRRVALAEVVTSAIEMASPLLEKRGHDLRVEVEPRDLELEADPTRLRQIVANLLTNAARYTEPGGTVSLQARQEGRDVVLRIEDSGIGLSAEQVPHLFERFFQGSRSIDRAQGGLGLGLALVKSFVELHGGAVRAESAGLGKGSTFEVRLPQGFAGEFDEPKTLERVVPRPGTGGERVLLIDDSEDITDLFGTFLTLNGFEVRTAHDGPSALRVAADFKPTVAVLDLGLPVMDGYEVAASLAKQLGRDAPRFIAMSGYGREDDLERTRRAGFERHLVKPVDGATLLRAVARRPQ